MEDAKFTEKITPNLEILAQQAFLKVSITSGSLLIKHRVSVFDRLIWAIVFFFCGGVFLLVMPLFEALDLSSIIASLTFGLTSLFLAAYVFFRIMNDQVVVDAKNIEFGEGWKKVSLPIASCKTVTISIKRISYNRSMLVEIEHFVRTECGETSIFTFNMDYANSDTAIKLGKRLTSLINQRISTPIYRN